MKIWIDVFLGVVDLNPNLNFFENFFAEDRYRFILSQIRLFLLVRFDVVKEMIEREY